MLYWLALISIITGRNEVLAKVIFSQASVILLTGGGVVSNFSGGGSPTFPRGGVVSNFSGGLQFSGGGGSPEYGQRSAGTHPTGMHSCYINLLQHRENTNFYILINLF